MTVSVPPGGEGSVPLNTLSTWDGVEVAPAWWLPAFPKLGSLGLAMPHLLLLSSGAGFMSACALELRGLWEEARWDRSRWRETAGPGEGTELVGRRDWPPAGSVVQALSTAAVSQLDPHWRELGHYLESPNSGDIWNQMEVEL